MNLAEPWIEKLFKVEHALDLESARLWSLLDMLKFYGHSFVGIASGMAELKSVALESAGNSMSPGTQKKIREVFMGIGMMLDTIGLQISKKSADRLYELMAPGQSVTSGSLVPLIDELQSRIQDELEHKQLFCLRANVEKYFEPKEPLFGTQVDENFKSSQFDISEAGKCFAVERYTACVAHCMRALEAPMTLLAGDVLENPPKRDNWGDLLALLDPAIPKVADKTKQSIYSAAAVQFRFIKDAWRNHVMHARGKYTEEEADTIFRSCKALSSELAKVLKE